MLAHGEGLREREDEGGLMEWRWFDEVGTEGMYLDTSHAAVGFVESGVGGYMNLGIPFVV